MFVLDEWFAVIYTINNYITPKLKVYATHFVPVNNLKSQIVSDPNKELNICQLRVIEIFSIVHK